MEDEVTLNCSSDGGVSMFSSGFWVKVKRTNKNNTGSNSYLVLSLSWFVPYLIYIILNVADMLYLPPLA